ncbi:MAG: hypothetical protein AB1485_03260 [Candidatus Thermoplasmatota archaeon]
MAKESRIYSKPYDKVYSAAIYALRDCGFKIESGDINTGKVTASAKYSLRSWGENIEIYFANKHGDVEVTMYSTPIWPIAITFGKTKENIKIFFSALERYLGR